MVNPGEVTPETRQLPKTPKFCFSGLGNDRQQFAVKPIKTIQFVYYVTLK